MDPDLLTTIIGSVVISALVGGVIANRGKIRQEQKKLIAAATKSAQLRVEMYYRIRRRDGTPEDESSLRNQFHQIQEENAYYLSLLSIESPWLGSCYEHFIKALKSKTTNLIQEAWEEDGYGPYGKLENIKHPVVDPYVKQFAKDSRRLFNPVMNIWMALRHKAARLFKESAYER